MARVASRDLASATKLPSLRGVLRSRADALRGPRFRGWSNRPRRHDGRGCSRRRRAAALLSDPRVRRAGCSDRLLRGPRVRRTLAPRTGASARSATCAAVGATFPSSKNPEPGLVTIPLTSSSPVEHSPGVAPPDPLQLAQELERWDRGGSHSDADLSRATMPARPSIDPSRPLPRPWRPPWTCSLARPLSARESAGAQPPSVDRASSGSPARPVVDSGCVIDGPPRADSTRTGRGASARAGRFAT